MKNKSPCVNCISLAICVSKVLSHFVFCQDYIYFSDSIDVVLECDLINDYTGRFSSKITYGDYVKRKDVIASFYIRKDMELKKENEKRKSSMC